MMSSKKWTFRFLALSALLIITVMFLNYKIDRHSVFTDDYSNVNNIANKNFINIEFLTKNEHSFDSFIFGSSRVGQINPLNIKGGNYYNMTYAEAIPVEHLENIKLLIKSGVKIKNILLGLDDFSYEVNPLIHLKQLAVQSHYDSLINEKSKIRFFMDYLFLKPKKREIFNLFKVSNKKRYYDIYSTGMHISSKAIDDAIENNISRHIEDKKFLKPTHYEGNQIIKTLNALQEIKNLSKKYNFNLVLFFNPIHKTTYLDTDLNNFRLFKRALVKISEFYDFSGLNSITTNNYYYYETSHYRDMVADMIKRRIFNEKLVDVPDDFGVFVTKNNIDEHLKK